jgi:hypothetical protein
MRVPVTAIGAMLVATTTERRNTIATPPATILNASRLVVTQSDPDILVIAVAVAVAAAAAYNASGGQAREQTDCEGRGRPAPR